MEGIPCVIAAMVLFCVVPPRGPATAAWLTEEERRIVCQRLTINSDSNSDSNGSKILPSALDADSGFVSSPTAYGDVEKGTTSSASTYTGTEADTTDAPSSPSAASDSPSASDSESVPLVSNGKARNSNSSNGNGKHNGERTRTGAALKLHHAAHAHATAAEDATAQFEVKQTLTDPRIIALSFFVLCAMTAVGGLTNFLPALLQEFGFGVFERCAACVCCCVCCVFLVSRWLCDLFAVCCGQFPFGSPRFAMIWRSDSIQIGRESASGTRLRLVSLFAVSVFCVSCSR